MVFKLKLALLHMVLYKVSLHPGYRYVIVDDFMAAMDTVTLCTLPYIGKSFKV